MQRNREMVVRIPKELEQDFRLFVVLHGGQIVEAKDVEEEEESHGKNHKQFI